MSVRERRVIWNVGSMGGCNCLKIVEFYTVENSRASWVTVRFISTLREIDSRY